MEKKNTLWTRDFTILTLGSVVSMFGNAMSGFAVSLMVLDYSESTLLYALFIIAYTLPQIIMPIFSGALLDRFSRRKTIYTLDFVSAFLYAAVGLLLHNGWYNFPGFACFAFLVGSINSIYMTAYQSFYPLLITEGNYSKAYSISSVLETVSSVMIPVAAWAYNLVGIAPLLFIDAGSFFIAAVLETRIRAEESYIDLQKKTEDKKHPLRQTVSDIREGARYLTRDKGLLAITIYFVFSSFSGGSSSVLTLPYFRATYENGEYLYIVVWGCAVLGRAFAGLFHYLKKLPPDKKYTLALTSYTMTSVLEGVYLFLPVPVMAVFMGLTGMLGVTSYTIRVSATQSYVPDEMKGRFNGAFNMLNTVGALSGEVIAGALGDIFSPRLVIFGILMMNALAAIVFVGGAKPYVAPIYNQDK
ncbi:MAG: MFS transporter [Erysipelotrichales bacterium]|nr:MFS transporter [Erysipelotrichales bacterium]